MLKLKKMSILESFDAFNDIPDVKMLINTINARSFNVVQKDELFAEALANGDCLIPDGASIIKACKLLRAKCQPKERIAGWNLFYHIPKNLVYERLCNVYRIFEKVEFAV